MAPAKCLISFLFFGASLLHSVLSGCTLDTKVNASVDMAAQSRISTLVGYKWEWSNYSLSICADELGKHKQAGAVWRSPKGEVVLGKVNQSHFVSGDSFVLVEYRGGDTSNVTSCSGNYSTQILVICNKHLTLQGTPKLLELLRCVAKFELMTPVLCPPETPSMFPLVLGWTVFLFSLYCLVGVVYRRFFLQMRGHQQIPNLGCWSRIGRGCADACNWGCRCEEESVTRWDADDDRDDVLLRP